MTMNENSTRAHLRDKKRIVVKVGSSSLVHPETGSLDLLKLDRLVRVLCDFRKRSVSNHVRKALNRNRPAHLSARLC